jgi:putative membrane protein
MKQVMALLVLSAPLAAFAADDNPDATFFKHAAEAGIAEVDAGQIAQDKANNPAVKDFGAKMVQDHGAVNEKLKALAATKNVTLPTSESVGAMATEAKLKVLSGDTFDKSYIKAQIKAHQQAVGLFKKEAASGQDPDVKAFAASTLPELKMHLKAIKAIAADSGVQIKSASTS